MEMETAMLKYTLNYLSEHYKKEIALLDLNLPIIETIPAISFHEAKIATVYKGNIIKNLIMDCQSYTKYRPNETTGGIFVSRRRKEELSTGA